MNSYHPRKIYRIGVDFDLTLVDSLWPWVDWFNKHLEIVNTYSRYEGRKPEIITRECYLTFPGEQLADLMNQRQSVLIPQDKLDPMSYWRQRDLYDKMVPLAGACEFFEALERRLMKYCGFMDVEFVCVTKCEPEHEHSKRRFIPSHFGNLFNGFVSTDDKHLVAIDCLIDDNPKYVKPCNENGIFQIYVPQGRVQTFEHTGFCEEYLTVPPNTEYGNHFAFLLAHVNDVVDMLMRHHNYVR